MDLVWMHECSIILNNKRDINIKRCWCFRVFFFHPFFMTWYDFILSCSIWYKSISKSDIDNHLPFHTRFNESMLWCDILSYLNATDVAVNIIDIKESKIPSKQIYIFSPHFNLIITIFTFIWLLLIERNNKWDRERERKLYRTRVKRYWNGVELISFIFNGKCCVGTTKIDIWHLSSDDAHRIFCNAFEIHEYICYYYWFALIFRHEIVWW